MQVLVRKREAAQHFIDQAMNALLDRDDPLTAIVLAGAAEDVFQGLLRLEGREVEGARAQMVVHIRAFARLEDPQGAEMPDGAGHAMMRSVYNWLRHDDGTEEEPRERRLDFHLEAAAVVERAVENALALTGVDHPRMPELLLRFRDA